MKQEKCDEAIISFNKAITDRENTAVSAINAAVCSLGGFRTTTSSSATTYTF